MGRKKQPLTLELLIKEGDGTLTPEKNENSLEKASEPPMGQGETPNAGVATKKGRVRRRKAKRFKNALNEILSMVIAPKTVAEAVKSTPLGDDITYQEAILIAQVLKAANGDTQAAVFLRDTTGNKLKDGAVDDTEERTFESF